MSQDSYNSDVSMEGIYEEIADTILDEMEPNVDEGQDQWQQLVREVSARMARSMLTTTANTHQVLETIVMRGGAGGAQRLQNVAQLLGLVQGSAHVNDNELMVSLGAIQADEAVDFAGTRYYVRSAQLTAGALRQIVTVYEARYADPYLVQNLNNNVLAGVEENQHVYLRYVGCTTATTPTVREQTDASVVLQTRLGNFMQAAQAAHHPLQFNVYEVTSLRLPGDHALVDTHEQVLMHIFDRAVCLNSQPGGYYRSYQPTNEDDHLIAQVLDNNRQQLQGFYFGPVQEADAVREAEMEHLFHDLYMTRLPTIDAQRAAMINDALIHLFGSQATPPQPQGTNLSLLLIFGKDITKEDTSLVRGFFDGSRAGQLTRDLIASCLGSYEQRENFARPPFFDLFNCQPYQRNDAANRVPFEETAAAVVQQINPFVVTTLGFDPHATSFSSYRGGYSLGLAEHLGNIGKPFLSSGDLEFDLNSPDGADAGNMHIVIPHLHPGYVSYGSGDTRILRVMLLTWCRTMLLLACCIQLATDPDADVQPGTRAFCMAAMNMATEREDEAGFTLVFNQASTQMQNSIHEEAQNRFAKSVLRAMLRGDPAPGFGFDAITRNIAGSISVQANVGRYGHAQGARNSEQRLAQCRSLERLNYPLVRRLRGYQAHLHHPNPNSEWRMFFNGLDEGASIYHAILGRCSWDAEPLPGLTRTQTRSGLTQCEPPEGWVGGDEWKEDPELVLLAISQRMSRIRQQGLGRGVTPSDALRELYRRANLLQENSDIRAIIRFERSLVYVNNSHKTNLSVFLNPDGTEQRSGGQFYINAPRGHYYLDYDTGVNVHALVLKNIDGTLYQPLQLLYDWQFLQQSRDIVFPVFFRTVEYAGRVLRAPIIEELELPEEDRFTHYRLGNMYLRQMWLQNVQQPFVVCLAPENTPPIPPRLTTTFQEITGDQQRGIEPLVWEHLLVNTNQLLVIFKQWATIQSTRSSYRDENNQQIFYRNWTITDIHD